MRIGIVLVEAHARCHIEDLLQSGALIGGRCELGEIVRDHLGRIEHAFSDEAARRRRRHRFRHGLRQMQPALGHAVEITLGDDAAPVQHEETIGVAVIEESLDRCPLAAEALEFDAAQILRKLGQERGRTIAAPDFRGGENLAHMLEGPAIPRRAIPVGER